MARRRSASAALFMLLSAALAGCGGGGSSSSGPPPVKGPPPPPPTFTIGGSVVGLAGTLVLQNNGGDSLTVSAAGSFTFATRVNGGAAYAVTVLTQSAGQNCAVSNGSGTASANIANVTITCSPTLSIGGSVAGLAGTLVLQNNGGDSLTLSADGSFTFATRIDSGAAYAVTVLTQPGGQHCAVTDGSGTASENVADVTITCNPLARIAFFRPSSNPNTGSNPFDVHAVSEDGTGGEITLAQQATFEGTIGNRVILSRFFGPGNRQLSTVEADGSNERVLASGGEYHFLGTTSDRVIYQERVADQVGGQQENIWASLSDGTQAIALADSTDAEFFRGTTAAGRVVYFREVAPDNLDIFSINADGTGRVELAAAPESEGVETVTADGRVVFSRFSPTIDVYIVNADGSSPARLLGVGMEFAGFMPDGRVILSTLTADRDLHLVNSDGTGSRVLVADAIMKEFLDVTSDGLVIFSRDLGDAQQANLNLYGVTDAGVETTLAASPLNEFLEAFAPGGRIVYSEGEGEEQEQAQLDLYSVNADGSGTIALATSTDSVEDAITVTGQVIYRKASSPLQADLYAVNADGTGTVQLSRRAGVAVFNTVTGNGRVIYHIGPEGQPPGNLGTIYGVFLDGSADTELAGPDADFIKLF